MWKQRAFSKLQFSLVSQACAAVFFKLLNQIFHVISKSNGVRELMCLAASSVVSELGSC